MNFGKLLNADQTKVLEFIVANNGSLSEHVHANAGSHGAPTALKKLVSLGIVRKDGAGKYWIDKDVVSEIAASWTRLANATSKKFYTVKPPEVANVAAVPEQATIKQSKFSEIAFSTAEPEIVVFEPPQIVIPAPSRPIVQSLRDLFRA